MKLSRFSFGSWRVAVHAAAMVATLLLSLSSRSLAVTIAMTGDHPALPTQASPGWTIALDRTDPETAGDAYQWFFNDAPYPCTIRKLDLANVTVAQSGNYSLRVTHATGQFEDSNTLPVNVSALPAGPIDRMFAPKLPSTFGEPALRGIDANGGVILTNSTAQVARLSSEGALVADFQLASAVYPIVLTTLRDGSLIIPQPPYRIDASGSPTPLALPPGFSTTGLSASVQQTDGKLLLAQGKSVARLNLDGSVDPTFGYTDADGTETYRLQLEPDGRILIWGSISQLPGSRPPGSPTLTKYQLHRLLANGGLDPGFNQLALTATSSQVAEIFPFGEDGYIARIDDEVVRLGPDGQRKPEWLGRTLQGEWCRSFAYDLHGYVYALLDHNVLVRYAVRSSDLELDRTFYAGAALKNGTIGELSAVRLTRENDLIVTGDFDHWDDYTAPGVVRLRTNIPINVPPSAVGSSNTTYPRSGDLAIETCNLVGYAGTGPYTYEWIALDGQPLPVERNSEKLSLPPFTKVYFGRYQCRVTNAAGSTLSIPSWIPTDNWWMLLANISGRALSGTGEDTIIAGVTSFDGSAGALVRGVGPGLKQFGVTGFMPDPAVDVFDRNGVIRANNNQWWLNPNAVEAGNRLGAFPLRTGDEDAAVLGYCDQLATIHLKAQDGRPGVALLEVYQTNGGQNGGNTFANLSLRAKTGPGEQTAIAGFVIVDPVGFGRSARVLLRAIGPTLANQGITHPLENPVLTLFNGKGDVLAQNDDWAVGNSSATPVILSSTMKHVGAFDLPATSKDAALLVDLPAGPYTIHATGGSGVVLLEIYLVR